MGVVVDGARTVALFQCVFEFGAGVEIAVAESVAVAH